MKRNVLNDLFIETGRFCKVSFVTNSGRVSTVHGRTGVHKYIKGIGKRPESMNDDYILFWDRNRGYRNLRRDTIIAINGEKVKLEVR